MLNKILISCVLIQVIVIFIIYHYMAACDIVCVFFIFFNVFFFFVSCPVCLCFKKMVFCMIIMQSKRSYKYDLEELK